MQFCISFETFAISWLTTAAKDSTPCVLRSRSNQLISVVTITTMHSRLVIKKLEQEGWILSRVRGSHHQFKHPTRPGLVTVKHPDRDIPMGTLRSIQKQAGWV
jgi:predicted RNA binding protein YcfA (HicA-like mRNA interferase family)